MQFGIHSGAYFNLFSAAELHMVATWQSSRRQPANQPRHAATSAAPESVWQPWNGCFSLQARCLSPTASPPSRRSDRDHPPIRRTQRGARFHMSLSAKPAAKSTNLNYHSQNFILKSCMTKKKTKKLCQAGSNS